MEFDLIVVKRRPFSEAEIDRRMPVDVSGHRLHVATLEDVILSKLDWPRKGASRRQIEDIARLLTVSGEELDLGWIGRWVAELGLADEWAEARALAGTEGA